MENNITNLKLFKDKKHMDIMSRKNLMIPLKYEVFKKLMNETFSSVAELEKGEILKIEYGEVFGMKDVKDLDNITIHLEDNSNLIFTKDMLLDIMSNSLGFHLVNYGIVNSEKYGEVIVFQRRL